MHVYLRKFKIGQNFDPTTCQKIGIGPRTINPRKFFPEYSFHTNFRKSQGISAILNNSVRSYNKKTNMGGRIATSLPPPTP